MIKQHDKKALRAKRHSRIRGKVSGTALKPRVAVFRSLSALFVQAIDDVSGKTLVFAALREVKKAKNDMAGAQAVGELLGQRLKEQKIDSAVFDRAGYKYHGRVKALADGVRSKGITM